MSTQFQQYEVVRKIGEGGFGEIKLVQQKQKSEFYVMKSIGIIIPKEGIEDYNKKLQTFYQTLQEVQYLCRVSHPNIIGYVDSFLDDKCLHIVMEYANAGDLEEYLKQKSAMNRQPAEPFIIHIITQVCLALKHIHERHLIHRDIKESNILLQTTKNIEYPTVKLGDFGLAKDEEQAITCLGTRVYMAPEMLSHQPYDNKVDVWALGCVLYRMLTFKYAVGITSPIPSTRCSKQLSDLVTQMLQADPDSRPSIQQILELPFIKPLIPTLLPPDVLIREFPEMSPQGRGIEQSALIQEKEQISKELKSMRDGEVFRRRTLSDIMQWNSFNPDKQIQTAEFVLIADTIRKAALFYQKDENYINQALNEVRDHWRVQKFRDIPFAGQFENDLPAGFCMCTSNYCRFEYVGEFQKMKFNGFGIQTVQDGEIREGQFKDDQFKGRGRRELADGTVCEGVFFDYRTWTGRRVLKGGKEQQGYFLGDEYMGTWEGELRDGQPFGRGKKRTKDGAQSEGDFARYNTWIGTRILRTGATQSGFFQMDEYLGPWEGSSQGGMPMGKGRKVLPDGAVCEGEFTKYDCWVGKKTNPNGQVETGKFEADEYVYQEK